MTVYLVGAGPGDPGLLTVRGRDLLAQADVVLYDGLVDRRILDLVAPTARRIDVGKVQPRGGDEPDRPGHGRSTSTGPMPQVVVEALLVEHGRTGACVVRLKGGDPFIFGRGGEEALALVGAGIPFEIVPGVSSAIAAPAYAGIPVTHRGLAASVTIVTGHEAPGKPLRAAHVDWDRLATATDTLVILMGVGHLAEIALRLQAAGRPATTPAAVVEQGTTSRQRVVSGSLGDLAQLAAGAGVRSPAVIVVGEVARLGQVLAWYGAGVPAPPAPASTPARPAARDAAPPVRGRPAPALALIGTTTAAPAAPSIR